MQMGMQIRQMNERTGRQDTHHQPSGQQRLESLLSARSHLQTICNKRDEVPVRQGFWGVSGFIIANLLQFRPDGT